MNYYEITLSIPYFSMPDWFISIWLIVGGIGIMLQQFSIALVGDIKNYNRAALTLKNSPVIVLVYVLMLVFPPLAYYVTYKYWKKNK